MTPDQVKSLAEPILHAVLGAARVEKVIVREDDDWAGELSVDVFVAPGTLPLGAEVYLRLQRSLSDELDAIGERRFASLRLRDEAGERELDDYPAGS